MGKHLLITVGLVLAIASCAAAGSNPLGKGAVHVLPHAQRSCSENFPVIDGCSDIVTTEMATDVDVFPVFFSLSEYKEFVYSLIWTSGSSCVFTSCADYAVGSIVSSGDGIVQGWNDCQTGEVVVTGWGRLLGEGYVHMWMHPTLEIGGVYDCSGNPDAVCYSYFSAFGGFDIGDDACVPVDPSGTDEGTWGEIKAVFR